MRTKSCLSFLLTTLTLSSVGFADPWPSITIPAENAAALRRASTRPGAGDVATRAADLARALSTGTDADIQSAGSLFLQRDPFLAIKDMSGAAGYFTTLTRWYARDIKELRDTLPRNTTWSVDRVEMSSSCTWMSIGREANRLPYWSCYGSRMILRSGTQTRTVRIAVMINWGQQWFISHLQPIHRSSHGNH